MDLERIVGWCLSLVLSPVKELMNKAQQGGYAVPCFLFWDFISLKGVLAAAEKTHSPVILGVYEGFWKYLPVEYYAAMGKSEAERSKVPTILHLDHGSSIDTVLKCIQIGFNSVMIDGSELSLQDNISLTKETVEICHKLNIGVEGELGHTGVRAPSHFSADSIKTNPDEAALYVKETGVDSLSVFVGNVSGVPEEASKIDIELLEQIRRKVSTPLVLHGGTGVPSHQIKRAIEAGIACVHIGARLIEAYFDQANQVFSYSKAREDIYTAYDTFYARTVEEIKKIAEEKIKEFGSAEKA